MEAVGPVSNIINCLWSPLSLRIGYVRNLKENFEKLDEKARDLYARREDVKLKINRGIVGKTVTNECEVWIQKVEKMENIVKVIEAEYREKMRCLRGWCPNVYSRMKLGKRVVNMINDIVDLKENYKFEGGVVVDAQPEIVESVSAPTIETGTSTNLAIMKILECLKNMGVMKIGIWGMGGVGKTTIMKNVNNRQEIAQMFDIVIWITVSRDWSQKRIQKEVAQRLSLDLTNDESEDTIARRLLQNLKTRKFLILLDDVWEHIDLDSVGIPKPNKENGGKLIVTTRFRGVCNKMETDEEIKVEVLSTEEAWKLFHEKIGNVVYHPNIQPLARHVVEECGGLPLALIVVGGALRKEDDVHVWENAVRELRAPSTSEIEDMEEKVFKRLKFSYDRLNDFNTKNCFLYCALYPEDYEIPMVEIIEFWRADELINCVGNLAEERNKGNTILKALIDASLLERCHGSECVKMHDVIRDMALRITSPKGEGCRFLVRSQAGLRESLKEEEWEQAERISLMYNEVEIFPERPDCPMLSTLLLQGSYGLSTMPKSFFERMHALRVLNLSNTDIESLPPSLGNLISLRGLYLNDCGFLKVLPSQVGALKKLEVLQLKGRTEIEYLPNEIGELASLRSLRVSFCGDCAEDDIDYNKQPRTLMMIPDRMLSRFSVLEDLSIDVDVKDQRWNSSLDNMAEELGSLNQLNSLEFCFQNIESIERFIQKSSAWQEGRLTTFRFIVIHLSDFKTWDDYKLYAPQGWNRYLSFVNGDSIPHGILEVLSRSEYFYLIGHSAVKKLSEFGMENMNGLKCCLVQKCVELETIVDVNSGAECGGALLPILERIEIIKMPNLSSILEGLVPLGSFAHLRVLSIRECPKLRTIFSWGMLQQLSNLEELYVAYCQQIQELIVEELIEDSHRNLVFQNLKCLWLSCLPKLVSISKAVLAWPSLEKIYVFKCPNLRRLPLSIHNTVILRDIRGKREWWEALEWEDDAIKQQLQPNVYFYA